jgi:hypothetical protein
MSAGEVNLAISCHDEINHQTIGCLYARLDNEA